MDSPTSKILEGLQKNLTPGDVAAGIPWTGLNTRQREDLLEYARKLGDHRLAYDFLRVLVHISKDDIYSLKVLELASQHPSLTVSARQGLLHNMRRILDRLAGITRSSTANPEVNQFEALYQRLQAPFAAFTTITSPEKPSNAIEGSPVGPFIEGYLPPSDTALTAAQDSFLMEMSAKKQLLSSLQKQVEEYESRLAWLTTRIKEAETVLQQVQTGAAPPPSETTTREATSKVPPFVDPA